MENESVHGTASGPRRPDSEITDPSVLDEIVRNGRTVSLAFSDGREPYLVTMNHGFDEQERCLYLHCAQRGRKIDILRKNPRVFGQVLEDRGYLHGQCDHAYRTVHIRGRCEFVEDLSEKEHALRTMIRALEADPGPVEERTLKPGAIKGVCILRIRIESMTGKQGPSPKQEASSQP